MKRQKAVGQPFLIAALLLLTAGTTAITAAPVDEVVERAERLFTGNHYWQAIPLFDQALELDPKNVRAYHGRGNCYSLVGKPDQAIEDYSKWINLDPKDPRAYQNRGTAYKKLNKIDQAINDYNQALKLNPRYVKAHFNRGQCYEYLGQNKRALADYEISLKYCGNDPLGKEVAEHIEKVKSARGAD